jgi:hypothetical protein
MKFSSQNSGTKLSWWLACMAVLFLFAGCRKNDHPPKLTITTVASGLVAPLGIETDSHGNIWVSQSETTHDDGKVIVIKPNGMKYDAIINLSAFVNENSGQPQGTVNLLLDGETLYVLSGNYLYRADISHFKPGDTPIDATTLPYEDIAAFVYSYPFVNDANDSHPYNLTKGPDGDLYITDAGANAIIHRKAIGDYSVLAEVPGIANPTTVGPPGIQAVPTSILYDGNNFLVTTLRGFPFPPGVATVYKISMAGSLSVYQDGFTSLVDIAEGNYNGHIVVQYASSFDPATGFAPNTGSLLWVNGSTTEQLTGGLNMPTAIKQVNNHTWYVSCMGDGTVLKVSYN